MPVTGPFARAGRDVLRGAELAVEAVDAPVELVALDSYAAHREARAVENARRAIADEHVVAYLGDFHSSQVARTAPLLGEAGLLAVAPVATQVGLRSATLVRLSPDDAAGARAIAAWLVEAGVERLLVVHDHDADYGRPVGSLCADAARERGLDARSQPVWDAEEDVADDLGDAQAVLYVGVAGSGAVALWRDLHEARPDLWLLSTDGVAQKWLARELSPAVAARTRFFVPQRAPLALYGHEAAALVLAAIAAGAWTREQFVEHVRDRNPALRRACGRLAVVDGALVWD